jgi:hypothetical protein
LSNSITINFAIVGSSSGTLFTRAIPSPDFTYAWLGIAGKKYFGLKKIKKKKKFKIC